MIDFRPISFVIGILLATLGIALIIPTLIDLGAGNSNWLGFAAASLVTLFFGVGLGFSQYTPNPELSIKQAFLLTTLAWLDRFFSSSLCLV